jgi:hypothetical protein
VAALVAPVLALAVDDRIVVGGAGAHIPVMQALADAYNARNPSIVPMPAPRSSSARTPTSGSPA